MLTRPTLCGYGPSRSRGAFILTLTCSCKPGPLHPDSSAKPFDDLLYAPMTMGMEASPDSRRSPFDPTGLCNAVIIAEPQATFIDHWMRTYVTFDEKNWAGHSVDMPWDLARIYPDDIQVLNTTAFFWPLWSADFIEKLHSTDEYNFARTGQYAWVLHTASLTTDTMLGRVWP